MKNCVKLWTLLCGLLLLSLPLSSRADDSEEGGLPIPRFASLRSGEVNMRVGPGARYSINWVYKKEGLPVEIIQEFDGWREIRDSEGVVGWVHKQMLQGKRMGIIKGNLPVLRKSPNEHATPVARIEPAVLVKISECDVDWCRIQVSSHKGWLPKTSLWGVYKKEKF